MIDCYAVTSDDFEYKLLDDGTAEITDYTGTVTDLSIPSVIDEYAVTSIGEYAFAGCESLTSITIPNSVTSIGDSAFSFCSSVTSIIIPDSVTSIGDGAFRCCDRLTSITIPDSVTSISEDALEYCSSLTNINVDVNNKNYSSQDGVLFDKNKTILIQYPIGNSRTSYLIPKSVKNIGYGALGNCDNLTSVVITDSVTSIGNYAFSDCSSLTSVTIPDSVTSIGDYAFEYCSNLKCVFYKGSEDDWSNISIGGNNDILKNANIHYNSTENDGYIPEIIQPSCEKEGYTIYKCSVCENSYNTNYTSNLGHSFTNYLSDNNATYTEDGTKTAKCDRCDVTDTIIDIKSAKGHKFNGGKNCILCGEVNPDYVDPAAKPTTEPKETTTQIEPTQTPAQEPSDVPTQLLTSATTTTNIALPTTVNPTAITPTQAQQETTTIEPASIKVSGTVYKLDKNGDYVSSKVKEPSISKATKTKKSFKATWKKVSAVSGYEVQYSTSKKFTNKTTKTKTVKDNKSKKPSLTVKKLKSKKTYYVRVRTYKNVKINGKSAKVYSSWSKVRSVKAK